MRRKLFDQEEARAEVLATISAGELSRTALEEEYSTLAREYTALLEQAKFLTRVSDRLEGKMVSMNTELNAKNIALETTLRDLTTARRARRTYAVIYFIVMGLFVMEEFLIEPVFASLGLTTMLATGIKLLFALALKPTEAVVESWLIRTPFFQARAFKPRKSM